MPEKLIQHTRYFIQERSVRQRRHFLQMRRHGLFLRVQQREPAEMRTSRIARTSLYSGLMRFCSPAPRLYARYDKIILLVPLSGWVRKKLSIRCPFVSGDSNNFTDSVSVFMGAILNSL